jgi:DnaJ-class molecular chaperone
MKPSDAVKLKLCPSCRGTGRVHRVVPVEGTYICGTCLGSGRWPPVDKDGNEMPAGG